VADGLVADDDVTNNYCSAVKHQEFRGKLSICQEGADYGECKPLTVIKEHKLNAFSRHLKTYYFQSTYPAT